ncbi:MAG: hypothetical protein AAF744_05505 [Pseudomonadota bacterium]
MSPVVYALIIALCFWMALCAVCGFRRRFLLFLGTVITGLTINQIWMMAGLQANFLEPHALMAQMALIMYGLSAFGAGWLVSRITQAWADSRIDGPEV